MVPVEQLINLAKERICGRSRRFYTKPPMHTAVCNCEDAVAFASKLRMLGDSFAR